MRLKDLCVWRRVVLRLGVRNMLRVVAYRIGVRTGGEGGMVTTDDRALGSKVWSLRDHCKNGEAAASGGGSGFRDCTIVWD